MKKIACVTGASSGVGRLFAERLAQESDVDELWLFARNEQELSKTAEALLKPSKLFSLDLSKASSISTIKNELSEQNVRIAWLINAAGFGKFGPFETMDESQINDMTALNCSALVALTRTTLPYMHSGSHILQVASAASLAPQPYLAVYAATKSFVKSFSVALRAELQDKNISVTALCPRFMKTNFLDKPGDKEAMQRFMWVGFDEAERCVEAALFAAKKNKAIVYPTLPVRAAALLCKLLPSTTVVKLEVALGNRKKKMH